MPAFRAVRVQKGSKKIVQILDESGAVIESAGGARADRAQAAVLSFWGTNTIPNIELRSDPQAAETLAAGYRTERMMKGRYTGLRTTAARFAVALMIEEAGQ